VVIGEGCEFAGEAGFPNTLITASETAEIVIGPHSRFNGAHVFAVSSVRFGSDCLVADAHLFDTDHHCVEPELRRRGCVPEPRPIVIEDNVWICSRAAIMKGVHVGRNAVIGYRAVVRRSVPENAVVIGNPAEVVKHVGSHEPTSP
jgi:acetyltransferase-like isoleucine patch superfamily enzyme